MPKITIYTTSICPYCVRAKQLFKHKGLEFEEVDVALDSSRRAEMIQRANGRRTVPQIFIDNVHVGGCDDLYELEHEGKLGPLLTRSGESVRA
jgi:glutaredoxin 3